MAFVLNSSKNGIALHQDGEDCGWSRFLVGEEELGEGVKSLILGMLSLRCL